MTPHQYSTQPHFQSRDLLLSVSLKMVHEMELRPRVWLGTELRMMNKASDEQNSQTHTTLIHIWLHDHAPPPTPSVPNSPMHIGS